jgi:hypothetical protein
VKRKIQAAENVKAGQILEAWKIRQRGAQRDEKPIDSSRLADL